MIWTKTEGRIISLIPVLWIALVLRVHDLSRTSLWNDEGNTVITARSGFGWTVAQALDDAVHPPLFFFLEKFNIQLLGESEFSLRWLAAAMGVAGVAAAARLGRRWLGPVPGWLSAGLIALAPLAVWYSREARMYSLLLLLNLGVMYFFAQILAGHAGSPRADRGPSATLNSSLPLALFSLLSAALYLTHYFGLFVPLVQFVFLIANFRRYHGTLARWTACQAAAAAPIAGWLYLQYSHGVTLKINWIQPPEALSLLTTWLHFTAGGSQAWQMVVALAAGLAVLAGWLAAPRGRRWLLLLWLVLPAAVTLAISIRRPLYVDRYFIGSLAPLCLLMGQGLSRWGRLNSLGASAAAALLAGSMAWQTLAVPDYHSEDWRGATQYVAGREMNGDQFLRRSRYYWAVDYYYHGRLHVQSIDGDWRPVTPAAESGRVWLIFLVNSSGQGAPNQAILDDLYGQSPDFETLAWLRSIAPRLTDLHQFGGVTVLLYDYSTSAP